MPAYDIEDLEEWDKRIRDKVAEFGTINIMVKRSPDGEITVSRVPLPPMPDELKQVIEEQKQ